MRTLDNILQLNLHCHLQQQDGIINTTDAVTKTFQCRVHKPSDLITFAPGSLPRK